MILAAALLVLAALGLFVGGIATGATALYWACVAVSAVAALLLILARRRLGRPAPAPAAPERTSSRTGEHSIPAARRAGPLQRSPQAQHAAPPDDETNVTRTRGGAPGTTDAVSAAGMHRAPGDAPAQPAADTSPGHGGADMPTHVTAPVPAHTPTSGDPPIEEIEVTEMLLIVDLVDDVFVVDEHPRYHLAACPYLRGRTAIPLPMSEARTEGFTPCAMCSPDRHLADVERARRAGRGTS